MLILILGLLLLLAPHSVAIVAPQWRKEKRATHGTLYAIVHSVFSLFGLLLIVWGFAQTRSNPIFIWHPPAAMYHLTTLLVLLAFILLTASFIPRNHFKVLLKHPMIVSVKVWAFAHLLANGRLGDIVLFGTFLLWAGLLFAALRKEDRRAPPAAIEASWSGTIVSVAVGFALWLIFALWLHVRLIGVPPF